MSNDKTLLARPHLNEERWDFCREFPSAEESRAFHRTLGKLDWAEKLVEKCVRELVKEALNALDSNWCTLELTFSEEAGAHELQAAKLNGPAEGTTDVLELVRSKVPRSALYAARAFTQLYQREGSERPLAWTFHNPNFAFVVAEDRTLLSFEHCAVGVVTELRELGFTVTTWSGGHFGKEELTVEQVRQELKEPHRTFSGHVVTVSYLNRDESGLRLLEEARAEDARAREEWERTRPQREAEEEARRAAQEAKAAAAYAALSPEGKAKHDERKAQLSAQTELVHALLPFLPTPTF